MVRKSIFLAVLMVLSNLCCAAKFTYSKHYDSLPGEYLFMSGEIIPGDYRRLIQLVDSDQFRFEMSMGFTLASLGGDVEEAIKIAGFVKKSFSNVRVEENIGSCVSACFFIYAAAVHREADGGTIGIHRPYISPLRMEGLTPTQAELLQNDILKQSRQYLLDLQLPTSIIDIMFSPASTEVYWLNDRELREYVGTRPPWYEQLLIARCGYDKAEEQKYLSGYMTSRMALDIAKVDACGDHITRDNREAYIQSEIQKLHEGKKRKH